MNQRAWWLKDPTTRETTVAQRMQRRSIRKSYCYLDGEEWRTHNTTNLQPKADGADFYVVCTMLKEINNKCWPRINLILFVLTPQYRTPTVAGPCCKMYKLERRHDVNTQHHKSAASRIDEAVYWAISGRSDVCRGELGFFSLAAGCYLHAI